MVTKTSAVGSRITSIAWNIWQIREAIVLGLVILMMVILSVLSPHFLTVRNLLSIAMALSMDFPTLVGMTCLIISGLFDLSVGSVSALCATVCGLLLLRGVHPLWVIPAGVLGIGGFIGSVNAFFVTRVRINAFIVTMGTMSLARGLALLLSQGKVLTGFPEQYGFVGRTVVAGLPLPVLITGFLLASGDFCLRKVRVFRQLYYVGGNEQAAVLSGVNVTRIRTVALISSTSLAATSGIILSSRLMASVPLSNQGTALQVIAAAVIGGASLTGGEGSMVGSFLGFALIHLINNALVLLNISVFWQEVVQGLILITAVSMDTLVKRYRR